jgi:hypothetical protein
MLVSISKGDIDITLGPIDFIALEFPGNRFRGEILPELFERVSIVVYLDALRIAPAFFNHFISKEKES